MLAKILDKPGDLYTMHNPNYVPQKPQRKRDQPEEDPKPLEDVYRATVPTEWTAEAFKPLRLSTFDKASAIQFVGDRNLNTVKGHKGYRMVRATSGVCEGDWYFEAKLLQHPGEGAVRLGWCQRRSDVETPVGFDAYGFGIRDRTGEFIHSARLKPYGLSFAVDDVIGCRITLPQLNDDQKAKIAEADQKWLEHRFIAFLQGQTPPDSGIDIILESCVQFYKNGVCMGVPSFFTDAKETAAAAAAERQREGRQARKGKVDGKAKDNSKAIGKPASTPPKREMKAGVYFPALALFGNAVVKANFGPEFEFPLPEGSQPMCQAARDAPPIDLTVSADPDVDMTKGSGAIEATQDNKTSEARAIQSVAASGSGTGNSASKNEKSNGIGMQVPETIDLDSSSDVIEVAASTLQNDAGQQKQETEAGRAKTE